MNFNELHIQAKSGDKNVERRLFLLLDERFRVFANHRVWNKEDAEEVVQDSLAIVAREYCDVEIQTSFQAWAYKVLDNRILAYIKKRRSGAQFAERLTDQANAETNDLDLKRRLQDCLKKIVKTNRRYGRILNLGYQGYNMTEICDRLGTSMNNSYVVLSRARSLLELCLRTGRIES